MELLLLLFPALLLIAITAFAWPFINSLWLKPKRLEMLLRQQGFKGNPYRPISGDLPEMNKLTQSALSKPLPTLSHDIIHRIVPFEHHTIKLHGENSFMWYGKRPRVNIAKPELIKKVFAQYEVFRKQPLGTRTNFGLVLRDGQDWSKVRRIINPAFHMDKLKNMMPLMEASCDTMLRKWEEITLTNGRFEVDVFSTLQIMAADVIARTGFGISYEEGKRLFQLEEESIMLKLQIMHSITNSIPGWRYIPTKKTRKIKALDNEIARIATSIIESRKRSLKQGSDTFKDDLLDLMLEANEKEKENDGVGISMEELILECRLFLVAGRDTVSTLLTWTMVLLSQNQDWQTKARDEVLQHLGKDKSPDAGTLTHLKIMTMILNETLRLYPPATGFHRVIAQDTKLMDLSLTHDMEVSLPITLVHRDPKIWGDDADKFSPARFSGGVSSAASVPGSFFPFGGGPRICIGQHFALMEAKLTLAKILQKYTFELSPSYVHAPTAGTKPQFGALLIFEKL